MACKKCEKKTCTMNFWLEIISQLLTWVNTACLAFICTHTLAFLTRSIILTFCKSVTQAITAVKAHNRGKAHYFRCFAIIIQSTLDSSNSKGAGGGAFIPPIYDVQRSTKVSVF